MNETPDAARTFARYQEIRARLPDAAFPAAPQVLADLSDIADDFDVFVLDSYGVLNAGPMPVPGAGARLDDLRRREKRIFVLTNAASLTLNGLVARYQRLGYDFAADEIVSGRGVMESALAEMKKDITWDVVAPPEAAVDTLPCRARRFEDRARATGDGVILLSSQGWTDVAQAGLHRSLAERPRPLWVANPDLVAPQGDVFSREPGWYAHVLAGDLGIAPVFFGKPFPNAFDAVRRRFDAANAGARVLMVGDTLHTDILGGASAGMKTALVTGHGVLRGLDVDACIAESGIVPDYVLPTI